MSLETNKASAIFFSLSCLNSLLGVKHYILEHIFSNSVLHCRHCNKDPHTFGKNIGWNENDFFKSLEDGRRCVLNVRTGPSLKASIVANTTGLLWDKDYYHREPSMLHVLIITVECKMLEGETAMSWPGISTYRSSIFQEYDKNKHKWEEW